MGPARSKREFPDNSSVQTWHQRIGIQLWQRDTEYQMTGRDRRAKIRTGRGNGHPRDIKRNLHSGFIRKVKSQMNKSTNCSGGASLNGHLNKARQRNLNKSNITQRDEITSDDAIQHVVGGTKTSLMFLLIKWNQCLLVLFRGCMNIYTKWWVSEVAMQTSARIAATSLNIFRFIYYLDATAAPTRW